MATPFQQNWISDLWQGAKPSGKCVWQSSCALSILAIKWLTILLVQVPSRRAYPGNAGAESFRVPYDGFCNQYQSNSSSPNALENRRQGTDLAVLAGATQSPTLLTPSRARRFPNSTNSIKIASSSCFSLQYRY